jgi:hypothetical protein
MTEHGVNAGCGFGSRGVEATGLKNVQIGAAPAEIAGHSAQKLRFRRRWGFV